MNKIWKRAMRAIFEPEENSGIPAAAILPVGTRTLRDEIMDAVQRELSVQAAREGKETFEEADDFDVPDEAPELTSGYEIHDMPYVDPDLSELPTESPVETSPTPGQPSAAEGEQPDGESEPVQ